ncbi:MAG TPA: hypothetical protein VD930_13560 [Gemmatimonadales bacterium]|nr:hypothetical protein [Gemmatimonadales bacterium]
MAEQSLASILDYMKQHGSSVTLNWGEDNNLWECSWITGGKRYTGFREDAYEAALESYYHARAYAPAPPPAPAGSEEE